MIVVAAFVAMGAMLATQAIPPPIPVSASPTVSILILALLFIFMGTFAAFLWGVLSVDSRPSVDTPHVATPDAPQSPDAPKQNTAAEGVPGVYANGQA